MINGEKGRLARIVIEDLARAPESEVWQIVEDCRTHNWNLNEAPVAVQIARARRMWLEAVAREAVEMAPALMEQGQ